ncbi:unnamed protein product [Ixodes pacificus]
MISRSFFAGDSRTQVLCHDTGAGQLAPVILYCTAPTLSFLHGPPVAFGSEPEEMPSAPVAEGFVPGPQGSLLMSALLLGSHQECPVKEEPVETTSDPLKDEGTSHSLLPELPSEQGQSACQEKDDRHQCRFCSYSTRYKTNITTHEMMHTEVKPFHCRFCRRTFRWKTELSKHERVHTGDTPFACQTCHVAFALRSCLTAHQKIHAREKRFSCEICHEAFTFKAVLRLHMRSHVFERRFRCGLCGRLFKQKRFLTSHLKAHTGERPFACGVCGKAFREGKHVRTHHKRVHLGIKPLQCTTCLRAFGNSSNLADHVRTHTGERPFKCESCGRAFTRKYHLTFHRKRKHVMERLSGVMHGPLPQGWKAAQVECA